jgi:hypothetical protein
MMIWRLDRTVVGANILFCFLWVISSRLWGGCEYKGWAWFGGRMMFEIFLDF